jgi:hypothetical protein
MPAAFLKLCVVRQKEDSVGQKLAKQQQNYLVQRNSNFQNYRNNMLMMIKVKMKLIQVKMKLMKILSQCISSNQHKECYKNPASLSQ